MTIEHPVERPITSVLVYSPKENGDCEMYMVGKNNVTRIEACTKSGLHADVPYVRVWNGEDALAEFCQHNIVGVYFND